MLFKLALLGAFASATIPADELAKHNSDMFDYSGYVEAITEALRGLLEMKQKELSTTEARHQQLLNEQAEEAARQMAKALNEAEVACEQATTNAKNAANNKNALHMAELSSAADQQLADEKTAQAAVYAGRMETQKTNAAIDLENALADEAGKCNDQSAAVQSEEDQRLAAQLLAIEQAASARKTAQIERHQGAMSSQDEHYKLEHATKTADLSAEHANVIKKMHAQNSSALDTEFQRLTGHFSDKLNGAIAKKEGQNAAILAQALEEAKNTIASRKAALEGVMAAALESQFKKISGENKAVFDAMVEKMTGKINAQNESMLATRKAELQDLTNQLQAHEDQTTAANKAANDSSLSNMKDDYAGQLAAQKASFEAANASLAGSLDNGYTSFVNVVADQVKANDIEADDKLAFIPQQLDEETDKYDIAIQKTVESQGDALRTRLWKWVNANKSNPVVADIAQKVAPEA